MNFTTAKKEYLKQGSVSLCFMVVVPLPLRSASSIAAHTPPPQLSTYWAVDVFPPLYKLVFARFRQSEARTLKALRWRWPSHTNVLLKAELVRLLADETEQPLHDFVDGLSADRIRRLEPTIPEPRREQLAVAAAESAAKSLDDLREMRAALGKGGSLGVLASHVLGRVPPSLPPVRRQSSEADAARGSEHEAATVRWARARWPWPEHAVVSSCYLAGPVPNADGGTIKAEFDALVVRREPARGVGVEPAARAAAAVDATTEGGGAADAALADGCELQLIALVEAKAGSPLYADLPKLLRARELLMKCAPPLAARRPPCLRASRRHARRSPLAFRHTPARLAAVPQAGQHAVGAHRKTWPGPLPCGRGEAARGCVRLR